MPVVRMTISSGNAESNEEQPSASAGRKPLRDIRAARCSRVRPFSSGRQTLPTKGRSRRSARPAGFFIARRPRNQSRARRRAAAPIRPRPAISIA